MRVLRRLSPRNGLPGRPTAYLSTPQRCATSQLWQRSYSNHTSDRNAGLPVLDPSKLSITKTTTPKELIPPQDLVFGRNFSGETSFHLWGTQTLTIGYVDHMLSMEWTASDGWLAPRITPYQNLSLDPATCVFHYAFECFEGMKAYKDKEGNIRLFRPEKNMERLNKSSARIALPTFDGDVLINLIGQFAKLDSRFIPK